MLLQAAVWVGFGGGSLLIWAYRPLRLPYLVGVILLAVGAGLPLLTVVFFYWLARRMSTVPVAWWRVAVRNSSIYAGVAGLLLTYGPPRIAVFTLPILGVMIAAHAYRPLSERNEARTLAAHWASLAVVCHVLAVAIPGPLVRFVPAGSALAEAHRLLLWAGALAVCLGCLNQIAAVLRAQNRRVTGLLPFWCVSGGLLGASLALFGIGTAQVYGSADAIAAADLIGWQRVSFGFVVVGMALYGVGLWRRRSYIFHTVERP